MAVENVTQNGAGGLAGNFAVTLTVTARTESGFVFGGREPEGTAVFRIDDEDRLASRAAADMC